MSGSLLFNHKFRKKGRNFSANLSLGNSKSDSEQDTRNTTVNYVAPLGTLYQYQFINQVNNNHNYGLRLTYSEPLTKTKNLDFSFSHNLNYSRNNKETYMVEPITAIKTYCILYLTIMKIIFTITGQEFLYVLFKKSITIHWA
ncbi:MAG: outer membrane beta-barrel protein [Chitinophagaceae bacterium]|nr:outer membrane beta-barrel protein [Chitinophagaceae bacterium]